MKKLNPTELYGPAQPVKKIECKNHILQTFLNHIKDMIAKKKVRMVVPSFL
jgi:hypothetical protein